MFTGLIERVGKIVQLEAGAGGKKFCINAGKDFELNLGDSVSVDGACLTVIKIEGEKFWIEASPETLKKTTLSQKKVGGEVNLERALRLSDRLGGHFVLGHIDGVGRVRKKTRRGEFLELEIEAPSELGKYLIEKGSIAVDGISLTINQVQGNIFSVMLIPETLKRTTISQKKPGDKVNLEADIIGKYVEKLLQKTPSLTIDKLKEEGY